MSADAVEEQKAPASAPKRISPHDSAIRQQTIRDILTREPNMPRHDVAALVTEQTGIKCTVGDVYNWITRLSGRPARKRTKPASSDGTAKSSKRRGAAPKEKPQQSTLPGLQVLDRSTFEKDCEKVLHHMQARKIAELRITADGKIKIIEVQQHTFHLR